MGQSMAFKLGNHALTVDDSEDGVVFVVGEIIEENKARVLGHYDNLYYAWNEIMKHYGTGIVLPKKTRAISIRRDFSDLLGAIFQSLGNQEQF